MKQLYPGDQLIVGQIKEDGTVIPISGKSGRLAQSQHIPLHCLKLVSKMAPFQSEERVIIENISGTIQYVGYCQINGSKVRPYVFAKTDNGATIQAHPNTVSRRLSEGDLVEVCNEYSFAGETFKKGDRLIIKSINAISHENVRLVNRCGFVVGQKIANRGQIVGIVNEPTFVNCESLRRPYLIIGLPTGSFIRLAAEEIIKEIAASRPETPLAV